MLDGFGDAAFAGVRGTIVEDSEQMTTTLRRRHALPALEGTRFAGKGESQERRKLAFSFHGSEQLFGDLIGTSLAGFCALRSHNPIADPFPRGVVELLEPKTERRHFGKDATKFRRHDGDTFLSVELKTNLRDCARTSPGASLHALVDEQKVIVLARREERSTKREAVNFTSHAEAAERSPSLARVEGDASDHPAKRRVQIFESCFEGFCDLFLFRCGFHSSIVWKRRSSRA